LGHRGRRTRPPAGRRHRSDRYPERCRMVAGHTYPWKGGLMAGNSQRRGAVRKGGSKKGQVVGSGGKRRRGLEGRGATPPAEARTKHPAAKRAAAAAKAAARSGGRGGQGRPAGRKHDDGPELVLGRNPVVECLRAGVPATALYVAVGAENDERLSESVQIAADAGISILEVPRTDLDRLSSNGLHQGIALQVRSEEHTSEL